MVCYAWQIQIVQCWKALHECHLIFKLVYYHV